MKSLRIGASALVVALLALFGCTTYHTVHEAKGDYSETGIYYSLPRTAVIIDVPIKKVFYTYGDCYPDGLAKPNEGKKRYSIGPVEITSRATADPDHRYVVNVKGPSYVRQKTSLKLNEWGLITETASESSNLLADELVAGLEAVTKIAATVTGVGLPEAESMAALVEDRNKILKAKGDALTRSMTRCEVKQAEYAQLHDRRLKLIGGELPQANVNPAVFDEMLASLTAAEEELAEAVGEVERTRLWVARFQVVPAETGGVSTEDVQVPLLKYDPEGGVQITAEPGVVLINEPPLEFFKAEEVSNEKAITLTATITHGSPTNASPAPSEPDDEPKGDEDADKGYSYRIPADSAVCVRADKGAVSTKLAYEAIPIAQFGPIVNLPSHFSGKNSNVNLNLNPNTGGLAQAATGKDPGNTEELIKRTGDSLEPVVKNLLLQAEQRRTGQEAKDEARRAQWLAAIQAFMKAPAETTTP